ncbi:hypothetical protein [Novosphingobium sp.]|uniref:hypothetical protein n=1 Tax=Novosphingobium sp. TaxID=1874826 RepID=UPI002FDF7C20
MHEQIRTSGAWSGEIDLPQTVRVYFEHRDGTYHPGLFAISLREALQLVVEYGLEVPRAFVTLRDEVILDVREGELEFPDEALEIFNEFKSRFPLRMDTWIEPENLEKWVRSRCAKLTHRATAYAEELGFDGQAPEDYDHPVNRLERELQSVAANYGLNLFAYGYQVPGVICAELERFGPDIPTGATDAQNLNVSGAAPDGQESVGNEAQVTAASLHPSAAVSNLAGKQITSPPPYRGALAAIPRRWLVIGALGVIGAALIFGNDLDDIAMKLFMVAQYSIMAVLAYALYRALDSMVWGASSSGSADEELEATDEFDLQNWRDGRVPRYMDETDPASGPDWIGNRVRDQIIKDHADRAQP